MYRLFEKSPIDVSGGFVQPGWPRVQTGLQLSLQRTMVYYRRFAPAVNNQHILVRLLDNLNVPLSMDIGVYCDKVADRSLDLAMSLKMTSPLSKGKIFSPGVFCGRGVDEVLLANVDWFDVSRVESDWQELQPLRALYHPGTSLYLPYMNGPQQNEEGGCATIAINIPMLAAQYHQWCRQPENRDKKTSQFVANYPLVNLMPSSLEIALFNRLVSVYVGSELPTFRNPHPFHLVDWTKEVDEFAVSWIRRVANRGWDFDTIISNLPTAQVTDYHDIIKLPEMAYSVQVQWGVVLSRMVLVMFLVRMNAEYGNQRNNHYLNQLRIFFRAFFSNRSLESALSPPRADEFRSIIKDGILEYL